MDNTWYAQDAVGDVVDDFVARMFRRHAGRVIDGEVVDAPHVLAAAPAEPDRRVLVCARHAAWEECGLARAGCVQHFVDPETPDERTWTGRLTEIRVVDRRRPH